VGVDLQEPPEIPPGCEFIKLDVLDIRWRERPAKHFNTCLDAANPFWEFCVPDFIVASSPCEQFSVHGMKHFHPNPKYPEMGIKLFNHTRQLCEASGLPYVMENVRAAQQFVGNAVPPLLHHGIIKGMTRKACGFREYKGEPGWSKRQGMAKRDDKEQASRAAIIPPELANCVCDYAERL